MATTRRVIVLCDGTWCGRETNTKSNIYFLAKMIGVNFLRNPAVYESSSGNIHARYFDGVGLDGDFMSYIWNGAFATQARKECTEVYKFVANNFASNPQVHTEVWMFGISRGAYIVRSVAGMINNCGIIEGKKNKDLIDQAYDIYRSPYPVHEPQSAEMIEFREKVSYKVSKPPIKFMGLFDTVGSRGVPKLNYHTGTGFEWPEFYDTNVSSEVEKVYHAVATHDRFWAFQPCLVSRNSKNNKKGDLEIHQKWFPGCHYDIARQEFQFLREGGSRLEKILFPILNMFSKTIVPNEQLADLVLLWVLESIETTGGGEIIQHDMAGNKRDITRVISDIKIRITSGGTGTGDIYEHILSYLPGGNISFLVAWFENFDKTAYAILFKPRNRGNSPEPDPGKSNLKQPSVYNEVYNYTVPDPNIRPNASGTNVIETSAKVNLLRYPSETYQNYCKYMEAVGRLA
ncbi:hypothetical protein B0J11DRAFT_446805 [Dendryphion nanum]|uniref:T6SS Phospholipase effector Tle1-like catalytic domain-containing protein n=1 Tax=Dendryphion nanum TaxID=256645 RepID=A0A9P9D550_9PLEO|nr:hypothetical protein B0J11DRAFT_446805 [Dendryphion nanum]